MSGGTPLGGESGEVVVDPGAVGGWLGAVSASSVNLGSPSRIGKELIPGVPLATPNRLAPDDMPVLAANRAPPFLQIDAIRAGTRLWELHGCKSTAATRTSSAVGTSVWSSTTCCGCRLRRRLGRRSDHVASRPRAGRLGVGRPPQDPRAWYHRPPARHGMRPLA